ncbi:MAG: EcsC family protein [Rhodothermaceae bacterium]|nr:EcsC family protein [Rhodothermaceae bacterium]
MKTYILNQLYPKAIEGLPTLGTPGETAAPYRRRRGPLRDRAERMTQRHIALAGGTGFVTGLGGWLTMPITLPADLAGVALLQLHMAASCAVLAGHADLTDEATRDTVVACLLKTNAHINTEEEEAVSRVGVKLAERGVRFLVKQTGTWIASTAGKRLIARRFARGIPLVGGVIGATSDAYNTRIVAGHTLDTFFPQAEPGSPSSVHTNGPASPSEASDAESA